MSQWFNILPLRCPTRPEQYRFRAAPEYWPLMYTDERGSFDSLAERVLGAVFEVSEPLEAPTVAG